jgi:hypothetical protein
MPDDTTRLIQRLIGGGSRARTAILQRARTDAPPEVLIAAALIRADGALLARARGQARTTKDRQLAAIAAAHLDRDEELLDALVRDHLADHPDSILAAWIATQHRPSQQSTQQSTQRSTQE